MSEARCSRRPEHGIKRAARLLVRLLAVSAAALLAFGLISVAFPMWQAQMDAVAASQRHAGPGVLESDVIAALGEPDSVYDGDIDLRFDRPSEGRALRYYFGYSVTLYVFVDEAGVVQCSLVELG